MKTTKNNLSTLIGTFALCVGMIIFPACKDDDEDVMIDDNICAQLECLNGDNAIRDVECGYSSRKPLVTCVKYMLNP